MGFSVKNNSLLFFRCCDDRDGNLEVGFEIAGCFEVDEDGSGCTSGT